jgi:hypothetical protein
MKHIADVIKQVCQESHVPMAQEVFGDAGLNAVFKVMEIVQLLYQHIEPERINGQVIVFQMVRPAGAEPTPPPVGPAADFAALANQDVGDLCFEIAADGRAYTRALGAGALEKLVESAVVYRYHGAQEEFLAGSKRKSVPRLDASARSQFSVPTFSDLRTALQHYARENIRESSCYIFRQVWYDANRLFFTAGPESLMRDSLTQFLSNRLGGDHDVWPEQNVNEKNPVDIRVQPRFRNNRLMLVEIKWLGDSADADDGHITASRRDARAQDGADQLANYLNEQRRSAPGHVIQGYYVIIDARRRNLPDNALAGATIKRADGLHYENQAIAFDPAHHQTRRDFDEPYRMFACPVCCE